MIKNKKTYVILHYDKISRWDANLIEKRIPREILVCLLIKT